MTVESCRFKLSSRRKTVYTFVCELDHPHEKKHKGVHPKGMYFIDMNNFWGQKQPGTPITAHDFNLRLHYFPDRPHYGDMPTKHIEDTIPCGHSMKEIKRWKSVGQDGAFCVPCQRVYPVLSTATRRIGGSS